MSRKFTSLLSSVLVAASLSAGAAQAQLISDTNDYTLSWTGSSFAGASTLYAISFAYGTDPFTDTVYDIFTSSDASNLSLFQGGDVTISSPSLTPSPPYPNPVVVTFSGDGTGTGGFWGLQYNTVSPLTLGTLGGLPTLTLTTGDELSIPGVGYYVFAYLPGNWTTQGTAPGDYTNVSVASGFSTPMFTYDMGTGITTVESFSANYPGDLTSDLTFTLVGGVPEPSTWAMLLIGFGGLGFWSWRRARVVSAAV